MNERTVPLEEAQRRADRKYDRGHIATDLAVIYPDEWQDKPIPPRRWIVDGLIPCDAVTLLSGDGGIGKSLLGQQLLTAAALGRPWLGIETMACNTMAIFCEDTTNELMRRQADILRHYDAAHVDLECRMAIASRVGLDNVLMDFSYGDKGLDHGVL